MPAQRCAVWWIVLVSGFGWFGGTGQVLAQAPREMLPQPKPVPTIELPPSPPSILPAEVNAIDLPSALRLAGVQNPEILLARQRVTEAVATRQLAAAQFLPTINLGTNYDTHTGPLQRSTGQIIQENRGALYLGLGAYAVGAGTVNVPGVVLAGNVSETIFAALVTRQIVRQREFAATAVRNDVLLAVAVGYLELLRAEGRLAVALRTRGEAREVARVTAAYAKTGRGRQADADRAATELEQRNADVLQAEGDLLTASARLAQVLDLDPSVRLRAVDGAVVPAPLVPDPIPLPELLVIALTRRPELGERQAAIRAGLLALRGAKLLPFSPNVVLGFSAGEFGGGSNLAAEGILQADGTILQQPRFGSFDQRVDFDAVVYWSLRNLGLGNLALVRLAQSRLRAEELRRIEVLDRVRAEVATAYARTHARFAQIATGERAVRSSQEAFREDLTRTRNGEGLPIEVIDSLRLLGRSRYAYLDAIVDYNRAQFELYVALGQPPADCLARPVPADVVLPAASPERRP
ncbi:MAG TPA: TolC family protein [Gemmataceae bacterium]|nr:TolC family protein [Gemmataceae bacterium]